MTAITLSSALTGFSHPIFATGAHDGTNRLFVVQQTGQIMISSNGATLSTPFLDISSKVQYGGEQGLLGLAFSPGYKTNRRFYIYYNQAGGGNIMVAAYTASATNPNVADAAGSAIIQIDHSTYTNHNGGMIAFGPDGYLYIGTGDGGGAGNPLKSSQDLTSLLGKILRIDVDGTSPGLNYRIPANNPLADSTVVGQRHEIWAYGLRNPWRWSFDSATGDIWIGDVGQDRYEEVDHVSRALLGTDLINFGWNHWEGRACYDPPTGCSATDVTMPVAVYAHGAGESIGCAITGGYVYRGPVAGLRDNYFFGDYCSGRIWRLVARAGNQAPVQVADTSLNISSFALDDAANLYVLSAAGSIYKIGP